MRSGHCSGSAGRRWPRRMTGCTPVHGNIQNAAPKTRRASSELGYRQTATKSGALGCQPDKHGIIETNPKNTQSWVGKTFYPLTEENITRGQAVGHLPK